MDICFVLFLRNLFNNEAIKNLHFNVLKEGQTVKQGPLFRSLLKEKSKVSVFFLLITYSWTQWQGAKLISNASHLNLLFGREGAVCPGIQAVFAPGVNSQHHIIILEKLDTLRQPHS